MSFLDELCLVRAKLDSNDIVLYQTSAVTIIYTLSSRVLILILSRKKKVVACAIKYCYSVEIIYIFLMEERKTQ
jgi:hypothetical protein